MKLTIIGASGHGKVVADIAELCGYDQIEFLDDNETLSTCGKWPIVGKTTAVVENDVFVAIGNAKIRKAISERLNQDKIVTLIHPSAVIAYSVNLGKGTVVMAGAVINPYTEIGEGCIINTTSSVDHDCTIDSFSHISVGSHLSGTVHLGEMTWVGAGAIVSNNVNVCGGCVIGAGAVVISDIEEQGTYVGVPARKVK